MGPRDWANIVTAIEAGSSVDFDGSSGPLDFDANGDVDQQFTHQSFNASGEYITTGCWMPDGSTCD